jgi:hypothetical protein
MADRKRDTKEVERIPWKHAPIIEKGEGQNSLPSMYAN